MDSDDLATVKALRKAKKKEIQAWITGFEQREGRPPDSSDKEAVRPMYREFKDLEAKLAELTLAEETKSSRTNEPPTGTAGETGAVTLKGGGGAEAGGEKDIAAVKSERDAKKREIKLWIKEFEEREGRTPTTEDKAPIKALYREFKDLEQRLAQPIADVSVAGSDVSEHPATAPVEDAPRDAEKVKSEKKQVKQEIQTWLDEFEAREGRPAEQADKAEIRALYKRHKNLERELDRATDQVSPGPSDADTTAAAPSAAKPSAPEEPSDKPDADERALPSPASLVGAGETLTAQAGNAEKIILPEAETVNLQQDSAESSNFPAKDTDPESQLEKKDSEETTEFPAEKAIATAASAVLPRSGSEGQASITTPVTTEGEEDTEGIGRGGEGESKNKEGGNAGTTGEAKQEEVHGDGKSETQRVAVDGEEERAADTSAGKAATDHPQPEEPSEEKERLSEQQAERSERESLHETADDSVVASSIPLFSPADESVKAGLREGGGDSEVALGSARGSEGAMAEIGENSAKSGVGEEEEDSEVAMESATGDGGAVTEGDEDGNRGSLEAYAEGKNYGMWSGPASEGAAPEPQTSIQAGRTDDDHDRPLTAQEARVKRMRTRFLRMKNLIDDDAVGAASLLSPSSPLSDSGNAALEIEGGIASPPEADARSRWMTLGRAVAPGRLLRSPRSHFQEIAARLTDGSVRLTDDLLQRGGQISQDAETTSFAPRADDGVSDAWATGQLSNLLLLDSSPPANPPPPRIELLEAEASRLRTAVDPPPPGYIEEFQEGVRGTEVVVASVGVKEIEARERSLELERLAAAREETNVYRAREANLLYREDRARRRVLALKDSIQNSVAVEKQAVIEISIARERALAPAFARARRGLENAIRAQAGRVREVFGELRPGEVPGGRRFRVDWRGVPQPVEIRLHCIRAVRDRLPRGRYVMLSSMAERLGGRVMRWTKGNEYDDFNDEDSIDSEGGDTRPAATLPVQHGGRYYDRELRIDQNVYQLCPSKSDVRPGNVMVFELFRLAGSGGGDGGGGTRNDSCRHKGGELDEDTAVGWCVLPLADSRLRVIRGSFRIPLLRGEPNPNIDLHESMEKLIAADLEAWLGNLYLDVRHLPREARLEGPGVEGGSAIGGEGFDIEYDHVRKVVRLGKGLCANLAAPQGRWRRGWRRQADDGSTADEDGVMVARDEDSVAVPSLDGEGGGEVGGWAGGLLEGLGVEEDKKTGAEDADATRSEGKSAEDTAGGSTSKKKGWGAISLKNVKKPTENSLELAEEGASGAGGAGAVGASTAKKAGWGSIAKNIKTPIEEHARSAQDGEGTASGSTGKKVGWGAIAKNVKRPSENAAEGGEGTAGGSAAKKTGWGSIAKSVKRPSDVPAKKPDNWLALVSKTKKPDDPPPPDGGWVSANRRKDGGDSDDGIDVDKTIDEECLSDDDLLRGSKFRFTPVGEAAKAVDTAAGASLSEGRNAKGMGLRRRGEGARWDSSGLGTGFKGLPRRYGGGNANGRDNHVWTRLTNTAEMEYYRFAVASDPGTDAPPTPANIIRHKLRYIRQEILLDLHPRGWKKVEYWLAVMVFIGALWLRIYLHALGQWLMLYSLGVPVFSFTPRLWEFAIKYMDRSSSLGVEVAFVWWGPTFVTLCFALVAALARIWGMAACGGKGGGGGEGVPESFSRFVAGFGVGAMLDPYLLLIVDFVADNYGCSEQCSDYTSPSCSCHEGDAWKLYVRMDAEEGAGITGALLTIMIYTMVSITTALILHQYLLHAHMNGRMLDVWRRLNAREDDFFVPHDLEVSAAELQHACMRARRFSGAGGARREVIVHDFHAAEQSPPEGVSTSTPGSGGGKKGGTGRNKLWGRAGRADAYASRVSTMHVAIYDVNAEARKSLHRQFLRTPNGSILEMFGDMDREVGWQLRASLNALMREEAGGGSRLEQEDKAEKGIFAGMLPASAPAAAAAAALVVEKAPGETASKTDGYVGSISTEAIGA